LDPSDPFPNRSEIVKALGECRAQRNDNAHPDGDPEKPGENDFDLMGLVQSARKYLPMINDLKGTELEEVYKNLERLDDCLFYKDVDQEMEVLKLFSYFC
jgi:hypothetical protein